ncbi:MobA/VirD2-like nuclease domain-containing protein, partial [Dysosmobacter welbionis]
TANGDLTEIYVDDDTNDVTIVTVRTYVFQAASDYDTRKETVSLTTDSSKYDTDITLDSRTLDVDDFANITDLKADDYVLVTAVNNNSRYEVKSIDKAEVVNGTVEGYKDGSNVTMGGTKYEYSATADNIKKTSYNVGREASLVLDSYGYVIAVDESVVLSDYVYIAEFGSSSGMTSTSRALANAIFPDGTTDEIVVDKAYDKKAGEQVSSKSTIARWGTDADQIGWFTYSKNSADEYTLYAVESKYDEEIASYSGKGTVSENSKVAPFENDSNSTTKADLSLANDETIVIVSDKNDDLYVYTGVKNFPAIELTDSSSEAAVSALVRDNGYAALIYIDIDGDATISGEQETTLVYVLSYDGRYVTTDNEVYHQYTVLNGDEEEDIVADNKITSDNDYYGVAHYLTRNSDGQLTDFQAATAGGSVIADTDKTSAISQSAGTLTINGSRYLVTEDTAI